MSDAAASPEADAVRGLAEPTFDPNAMRVLKERYFARKPDGSQETPKEFLWRVASAVAQPERPYAEQNGRDPGAVVDGVSHAFYEMMARRDFMPNTPCLVNAGRPLSMLSACFVLPVPDSIEGIFYNLQAMARVQQGGGGCISGDARVWSTFCGIEPLEILFSRTTADGRAGTQRGSGVAYDVRDLNVKTLSMHPKTGELGLRPVSHVWKFDVPAQDQIVVRMREGTRVQTSSWHPFMVVRGTQLVEIRADALKPGDVVLGPENPEAFWPWKDNRSVGGLELDTELAWLIGFTLGDGSFGRNKALGTDRVRWFSGSEDVLHRVRGILALHDIEVGMSRDPRGKGLYVTTASQWFIRALKTACGIESNGPKDLTIRIPEMIGKSPLPVIHAFLAGLLDSDGCVDKDGSPSYTTCSEAMAEDLAALLGLLGFQPTIKKKQPHRRGKHPTYTVLLARRIRVDELAQRIAFFMSCYARTERLRGDSALDMRQLHLPFRTWRDELKKYDLIGRSGKRGPLAASMSRWACNYAGRTRRADLLVLADVLEPHDGSLAALVRRIGNSGQEIKSVEKATVAKPFYDLSVDDWNTYAAGNGGMTMIHNTGFAFSQLRPSGSLVATTGRDASGPVSFMKVFNAATDSIKQGGVRRGANMAVLRVDHPDIFEFMRCKKELDSENRALWNRFSDTGAYTEQELGHIKQELLQTQMNNFNISVGVTDKFMDAVERDGDFELVDPRTKAVVRTVKAREIWDAIVAGAWQNGEPGVIFLDHPEANPLPGLGPIEATNPCVTGDTLVAVADGRGHVRIDELACDGSDVPVFCLTDRGAVTVRTMRHPRKTGTESPILKIGLDDGSTVRVTPNHKFLLRDGTYKEARHLAAGDSLKIMTRFQASLKEVFPTANSRSQDYWWINNGRRSNRLEHRFIAEFAYNTAIPSGHVVHHKDYNAQNNAPSNLAILTRAEHDHLHRNDKLGDRNPMRRAKVEWDEAKWAAYRAKHSANNSGPANKRYSGVTNEEMREAALVLTHELKRRFSTDEWAAYALEHGLPQQFSGWRAHHLNGTIRGLSKWAARELGFLDYGDPRSLRHFQEALEQGYDAETVGGVLFVVKQCEVCHQEFRAPYVYREIAHCSRACSARRLNEDPEIHVRRHVARKKTLQRCKETLRERQLAVYAELKMSGMPVLKRDWVTACKSRGISAEISRVSSPFRKYDDLKQAATLFNHRVISVEAAGFADVYNGTVDEFHNFFVGGFESRTASGKKQYAYVCNRQCGEQLLHGYDSCNLGSINVGHFYDASAKDINWERLAQATTLSIRFLDNVIDANIYPLKEISDMVQSNRRVGLGIMGFADLLIQMEIAYGSPEAIAFAEKLMKFIQQRAEETSEQLARERGDFPNKNLSVWADDPRPRRNAALLSIAPTGTISMIAGCSFGCEPYFGMAYTKHVMKDSEGRPQHLYYVVPLFEEIARDEGFFSEALLSRIEENRGSVKGLPEVPQHWQDVFTTSSDVTVDQHIDMLAAFQKHTCNAVSKTVNAPNDDTVENVARSIIRAYKKGCKGFTYYRDGSRTEQVVTFSREGDIKGVNRDVTAGAATEPAANAGATAALSSGTPASATDSLEELNIEELLTKANALLETR